MGNFFESLPNGLMPPAPAPVHIARPLYEVRQGLKRVELPAGGSPQKLAVAGGALYYSRAENPIGSVLQIYPPGEPGTSQPLQVYRGGVLRVPFRNDQISVAGGAGDTIVVYVADDPGFDFENGLESLITIGSVPPSSWITSYGSDRNPYNVFDLTTTRPDDGGEYSGSAWTSVPSNGWILGHETELPVDALPLAGVSKIFGTVFDGDDGTNPIVSSVGTTLQLWWYINFLKRSVDDPGLLPLAIAEYASAGVGWVPDPNFSFTVAPGVRSFVVDVSVMPGYSPPGYTDPLILNGFTFVVGSIPAGAEPRLALLAQRGMVLP